MLIHNEGLIIRNRTYGGKLNKSNLFIDDLWWSIEPTTGNDKNRMVIVKKASFPIIIKADLLFKKALRS